jgi:hypothetical protein
MGKTGNGKSTLGNLLAHRIERLSIEKDCHEFF